VRCCFHAYKSVAPLKLNICGIVRSKEVSFHAYKSVAPLKRRYRDSLGRDSAGFHAYKSVAPLKLTETTAIITRPTAVSTLTKAWPH